MPPTPAFAFEGDPLRVSVATPAPVFGMSPDGDRQSFCRYPGNVAFPKTCRAGKEVSRLAGSPTGDRGAQVQESVRVRVVFYNQELGAIIETAASRIGLPRCVPRVRLAVRRGLR